MTPCLRPLWFSLIWLLSVGAKALPAPPEPLTPAVAWELCEFALPATPPAQNPFDPDELRIDAIFAAPSGAQVTLPAYWHQDYKRELRTGAEVLTPVGPAQWRIRFRPTEPGPHVVHLRRRLRGGAEETSEPLRFDVAPAATPGRTRSWVRVASDGRSFATAAGDPLLFSGHNVCWPGPRGTFGYDDYFRAMAAAGQNFARLWLAPWWAPLEHLPDTLTNYRLDAAWQLDHVFRVAEEHGIYLLLCLDHHGMYQPVDPTWGGSNAFWSRNPYSRQQGGPCAQPREFFELPAAKAAYQKRLRYLIGRYSHSPQLMSWQFFNEIDNIFDRAPVDEATVVAWHVEMARWLRRHDPYQHIISTSLTGGVDRPAFWELPEMEYTSYHAYWDPAPARNVAALMRDFVDRYQKPALVGEFGISGASWEPQSDPHLRGFRQHLWGGTLGGAATTALSWWWEDVHQDGALEQEAIFGDFLRAAGWFGGGWEPLKVSHDPRPPFALEAPVDDQPTFSAALALNPFRRLRLAGEFAVADAFAASRASEQLSAVLWGRDDPEFHRPLRLRLWAGDGARIVGQVASTQGASVLSLRVDDQEVERLEFAAASDAGLAFEIPLADGMHVVELRNEGGARLTLGSLRVEGVRPAPFAGGWKYRPEAVGLRRGREAMIYIVAPAAVYPAGAIRYQLPPVSDEHVHLSGWPAGAYQMEWIDPETGAAVGRTTAVAGPDGQLTLALPEFRVDVAARVVPVDASSASRRGTRAGSSGE